MIKFYKKLITVSALIGLLLAHTAFAAVKFPTDTGGTLTTGLVSYYKLEDVNDFYGSNNLTNDNSVSFNAGKVNNGADFGATNSTKILRTSTDAGFNGDTSISLWFSPSAQPANNTDFTITKVGGAYGGYDIEHGIDYRNVSGTYKLSFWRLRQGIAFDRSEYTATLTNGTWYHLVYTYGGTTVTGYLAGSSVATGTSSGAGAANYSYRGITIGARSSQDGTQKSSLTSGKVDEVALYSKALSTTEISDLYNGGNGQTMCTIGSDCPGVSSSQMSITWIDEY